MKEKNEECCSISNEEKENAIRSQCPNLLKKVGFDPVTFHNEVERLISYVCKNSCDTLSMIAIITLLNDGDIPGDLLKE